LSCYTYPSDPTNPPDYQHACTARDPNDPQWVKFPENLKDLKTAIQWMGLKLPDIVDTSRLIAWGFSAGGHLAATLSTDFAEPVYVPVDGADTASARPFATALVYPVVTMALPGTHPTSRELLLGPNPLPSQVARRSAELHVGAETPPLLLVHAIDDTAVPVSNSLSLLTAMRAADRPVEAHLFQEGGHAFASGYPNSPTSSWIAIFDAWLARLRTGS